MKEKTGITTQNKAQNLESPVVVFLAAMMQDFTKESMNEVYMGLGYYVSDCMKDFSRLELQDIVEEAPSSYSSFYLTRKYCINPALVPMILAHASEDLLEKVQKVRGNLRSFDYYSNSVPLRAREKFTTAFWKYLHDRPFAEDLSGCGSEIANATMDSSQYMYRFLAYMLQKGDFTNFFKCAPKNTVKAFGQMLCDIYGDMSDVDTSQKNYSIFFDGDGRPFNEFNSLIYVLQNELMTNGHLDELITKYDRFTYIGGFLKAIKSMYSKEYIPMYDITLKMMDFFGDDIVTIPHIALFFVSALLLDNSEKSFTLARSLSKKRSLKGIGALLHSMLEWKLTDKITGKTLENVSESAYNPSTEICFTLLALHFNMFPTGRTPFFMSTTITNQVKGNGMEFMRMLFSEETDLMSMLSPGLQRITGMTSFFNIGGKKARWQIVLETIRGKYGAGKKSSTVEKSSRVAYLVNPKALTVQPILQKATAGGNWSKGRNIALKNFASGKLEGMTGQDAEVAREVYEQQTWSGSVYAIDGRQAILALVGHPYVFTDDDMRLKIDIVEETLQLSVKKGTKGEYKFSSNIKAADVDDGVYIDASNPTSLRVVRVSTEQMNIVTELNALGKVPVEGKEELAATLSVLGKKMTVMSDLLGSSTEMEKIPAKAEMVVQLLPEADTIRANIFAKPLGDNPPYLKAGRGSEYVSGRVAGKMVQAQRDLTAEEANHQAVVKVMAEVGADQEEDDMWRLSIEQTLDVLDALNSCKEQAYVEWPEGVKMRVDRPQISSGAVHISVRKAEEWFSVEGDVTVGEDAKIKLSELLKQLGESKSRFIRLGDNEYVALSQQLAKLLRHLSNLNDGTGKHPKISAFNAALLDKLEAEGVDFKADRAYNALKKRIAEAESAKVRMPRGLQADLRGYQEEGFRWLSRLYMWGAGACLADDMGLGKTVQTIALLYAQRSKGPSLVVAPTSIQVNWEDEIRRFAPGLNPLLFNQASEAKRTEIVETAKAGDVVIASYGLLVTKEELLVGKHWNIIVLDEAHTIKNRSTKMSHSAMLLKGDMRVALTGTPLQNRLSEIWNIFQFLNPGMLGSFQAFTDRFILPIERDSDKDRQRLLKQILSPFILRRTKNDVLSDLPEKTEIIIRVTLSEEERAFYEKLRSEAQTAIEEGDSAIQALAEITRLRQAACNVQLVNPALKIPSSKGEEFMTLVENLIGNNHRALVFSQFTSHLALIREKLDKAGIEYLYLDGSTTADQRAKLVQEFQTGEAPLFLISLKAGGLGLNLTAADYVIHLDPWWNPAIEDQASDRSYRIGQQKPVTVYRIIAADTIEEKILRLHSHKKSLADALLEGSDMSARLTKEDILNLLGM